MTARAKLFGADLNGAWLGAADLRGARFDATTRWPTGFDPQARGADLEQANLRHANLSDARLMGADLSNADLFAANLSEANLTEARLERANLARLGGAHLRGAKLVGADLREAWMGDRETSLQVADLSGAAYDRDTLWPPGFDPGRVGAVLQTGVSPKSTPRHPADHLQRSSHR